MIPNIPTPRARTSLIWDDMPGRQHVTIDAVFARFMIDQLLMTREAEIARASLADKRLIAVTTGTCTGYVCYPRMRRFRRLDMAGCALPLRGVMLCVTRLAVGRPRAQGQWLRVASPAADSGVFPMQKWKLPPRCWLRGNLEGLRHLIRARARERRIVTVAARHALIGGMMTTQTVLGGEHRYTCML